MTTSLRDRRLAEARKLLERRRREREADILHIVRLTDTIKRLERQIARLEKPRPEPVAKPKPAATPAPPIRDVTMEVAALVAPPADDPAIPEFLRAQRAAEGAAKDAAARAAVEAEQAERKLAKSRGRVSRLLAKKSGEAAKMPLSGKAALEAIRKG